MTENNKLRIEHITSQDGKSVLYRLAGQMVVSKECYELLDTLRDDIRAGRARVVLNLENLERINSTWVSSPRPSRRPNAPRVRWSWSRCRIGYVGSWKWRTC